MNRFTFVIFIGIIVICFWNNLPAQAILFDFDNAPLYTSLPIDQTVNGITAHLSSNGGRYSIQNADVLGFTPVGFSGRVIYPNSLSLADLIISFNQQLVQFSIMYSPNELGCDNSATMRVTTYLNGALVGTNTKTASMPGTWPVDTLSCNFSQGFDSVIVNYDSPPPTCQDYGTIFMADNMRVTPLNVNGVVDRKSIEIFNLMQNHPNPFNNTTVIRYSLPKKGLVTLKIYNVIGKEATTLVNETKQPGNYEATFNSDQLTSGVYLYKLTSGGFTQTKKMILLK